MFLKDIFSGRSNIFLQAHLHTHTHKPGHVKNSFRHHKSHTEEQITGWDEGKDQEQHAHQHLLSFHLLHKERDEATLRQIERNQRLFAVRETTFSTFPAVSGACLCKICSHTVIVLLEHCCDTLRMFFTVAKRAESGTTKQNVQIEENGKLRKHLHQFKGTTTSC